MTVTYELQWLRTRKVFADDKPTWVVSSVYSTLKRAKKAFVAFRRFNKHVYQTRIVQVTRQVLPISVPKHKHNKATTQQS